MASAFVIWDRNEYSFIGGTKPLLFMTSLAATNHAGSLRQGNDEVPRKNSKTFDVITVTVA